MEVGKEEHVKLQKPRNSTTKQWANLTAATDPGVNELGLECAAARNLMSKYHRSKKITVEQGKRYEQWWYEPAQDSQSTSR